MGCWTTFEELSRSPPCFLPAQILVIALNYLVFYTCLEAHLDPVLIPNIILKLLPKTKNDVLVGKKVVVFPMVVSDKLMLTAAFFFLSFPRPVCFFPVSICHPP